MYVLEHSRKWWHEKRKVQCPDCETELFKENHYFMDILEQNYKVWKRYHGANYDMQYVATFKCNCCGCIFTAWSHIIIGAGPPVGSALVGNETIRNWNGIAPPKT